MSSSDFFWGLGDIFQMVLNPLDADWGITAFMNTGILLLGFVGLAFWLNMQRKFNAAAEANPDQRK